MSFRFWSVSTYAESNACGEVDVFVWWTLQRPRLIFCQSTHAPRYMNLIPRNTFVLDLELFVEGFDGHYSVCNSRRRELPVRWPDRLAAAWARWLDSRYVH